MGQDVILSHYMLYLFVLLNITKESVAFCLSSVRVSEDNFSLDLIPIRALSVSTTAVKAFAIFFCFYNFT